MLEAAQEVMTNSFNFSTKWDRTHYWSFILIMTLANMIIAGIFAYLHSQVGVNLFFLCNLICFGLSLTTIAPTVCRLRDAGFSPLTYLIVFIPIIGLPIIIFMLARQSN